MSNITSSGLRSSVSAAVAVALTTLLAWSFNSYTAYLQRSASDAITATQVAASASTDDRDARYC